MNIADARGERQSAPKMPLCEHPAIQRERLFPARDYITGDCFQIVQCRACGLVLTWPASTAAEMEKYYPPVYYRSAKGKRFPGFVELLQKFLYSRRVRRIERLLTSKEQAIG